MIPYFVIIPILGLAVYYFYPGKPLPAYVVIDRLVVYKSKHILQAWANGQLIKTYSVALGKNPIGHKQHEGDMRTPEGIYTINARNPNSAFYKNLGISYPNEVDRAHAATLGKPPGGDIKIHGLRNGRGYRRRFHLWKDWTHGCIAVTNTEMDELYNAVKDGAVVAIFK